MKNIILVIISSLAIISCSENDNSLNNLIESENFLKDNLGNSDVVEIEAGLQYKRILSSDSGIKPTLTMLSMQIFMGLY